ncbi:MAG: hypothetical protein ABWZ52_04710 [Acidimicrobiales bacterium]
MSGDRPIDGWAPMVERLARPDAPDGAANINVGGRRVAGPVQGFGKLWKKTYRVAIGPAAAPADVVATWRRDFGSFWPEGSRFYGPITGLEPGEVALLNLTMPGGLELSTGVLVLYADDEGFTLMTPEGHQFAGWITFSAFARSDGTVAQAEVLMRSSDPIYEVGMAFGGHRIEDRFWGATLTALAASLGVAAPEVEARTECMDKRRQWRRVGNVRHNAAVRSGVYRVRRLGRHRPPTVTG